jgi:hypothetical protein
MNAIAFGVAATVLYYLFARAEITRFLWRRYRGVLDRLARCPACSGWWIGCALSFYIAVPWTPHALTLAAAPGRLALLILETILWGGVWGLFLTPIGTFLLIGALRDTTIHDEPTGDHPAEPTGPDELPPQP